jgi:hypothetical protein
MPYNVEPKDDKFVRLDNVSWMEIISKWDVSHKKMALKVSQAQEKVVAQEHQKKERATKKEAKTGNGVKAMVEVKALVVASFV